ncbi:hypothetical protein [Tamlana sp. I1]|uniref:hypothetical protein n=1 Tax=Tamlana sp. I1 TaxID=2762061 RepID=UPI0018900BD2|nr:hypothetical protein [Tamlana sp. I1]
MFNLKILLISLCYFPFLLACRSEDNQDKVLENEPIEDLSTSTTATDSNGNSYEVGFNQVSAINQDPYVRKKNAKGESIWYIEHEKSEVDGRATLIFIDNEDIPWVVFTLVGGSYNEEYLTKREIANSDSFKNVYAPSYGNGGGPKVSIIAQLNPENGKIIKGSFVVAKKNDGKTNGFTIKSFGMNNNMLAFTASTAAWPPGVGTSYSKFPNITDADRVDNAFKLYYEMDTDLKAITKASLNKE